MSMKSFALCVLTALSPLAMPAMAGDAHAVQAGTLSLNGGFTRATMPGAQVAGGYVSIANGGAQADHLRSASASFAERVELHEMAMDGELMTMRALPDGIEIPAGKTVDLAPGGLHLMFMGLKQPLKQGEMAEVTLTFDHAGAVVVPLKIAEPAAKSAPGAGAMHGHQHGDKPADAKGQDHSQNNGAAAPPAQ